MTIWVLALLLLASLAGLGYRQGAIKVGFSLIGILLGALLAVPLGRLLARIIGIVGVKDPLLQWMIGPLVAFVIISILFKVAAAAAHQKVEVHYKYHAGDLRMALWERLNHRLGLCLGLVNGVAYLVLIAFAIYLASYATVQVATSESDPKWMRLVNVLGRDLHGTGLAKVARSIDRVPETDFQMADFAALLYLNPLAEARLRNYPAFLALSELPEFQALGNDKDFTEGWQRNDPVIPLLNSPTLLTIRANPDLLKQIWNTVEPDLADLRNYLNTGFSAKYDPVKILGRWRFDVAAAVSAMRRAKPTMPSSEMQRLRKSLEATLSKTGMVAKPDHRVTLNNPPALPGGGASAQPVVQGEWKNFDTKYLLSFAGTELSATVEGDRMVVKVPGMDWAFNRED